MRVGRAGKGVVDGEEGKSRASREKGKKAKGGKAVEEKEENGGTNGAAAEEEVWEVEFEDTVLFPEGMHCSLSPPVYILLRQSIEN